MKTKWQKFLSVGTILIAGILVLFSSNASYAQCASPAGVAGDQMYNSTFNVMQFCDGTNWQAMKGGGALSGLSCTAGQITQWNGSNWVCAADPSSGGGDNLGNHTATTYLNMAANHLIDSGIITTGNWNATYDAWLQGGINGATGDARNLALLGIKSTDTLYLNYNSEYSGGTIIGGPVSIMGGTLTLNGAKIIGLGTPTAATDAATKAYIDALTGANEIDPLVEAFAKISLPTCPSGDVLTSDGTTLTCITVSGGGGAGCAPQSVSWNTNCSGTLPVTPHGVTANAIDGCGTCNTYGYSGSISYSCNNGTWAVVGGSGSCSYGYCGGCSCPCGDCINGCGGGDGDGDDVDEALEDLIFAFGLSNREVDLQYIIQNRAEGSLL